MGSHTLDAQLRAFKTGFMARLPEADRRAVGGALAGVRAGWDKGSALGAGAMAPDFVLPDQHGRTVRLAERLAQGPVVLLFVRGGWCPFCTLTLRAYQDALPRIEAAGAALLGVTPQPAATCAVVAERDLLAFPMLSDAGNRVAAQYGGTYEMPEVLRAVYTRLGHDLPRLNGTGDWWLPFPATYVVGRDGRVVSGYADPSEDRRMEPADVLRALEGLGG